MRRGRPIVTDLIAPVETRPYIVVRPTLRRSAASSTVSRTAVPAVMLVVSLERWSWQSVRCSRGSCGTALDDAEAGGGRPSRPGRPVAGQPWDGCFGGTAQVVPLIVWLVIFGTAQVVPGFRSSRG